MVAQICFAVNLEPLTLTLTPWQTVHCHLHCLKHLDAACGAVRDIEGGTHAPGNACLPGNCKIWAGTPKLCVEMHAAQCLASEYTGMCDTRMFPCMIATD